MQFSSGKRAGLNVPNETSLRQSAHLISFTHRLFKMKNSKSSSFLLLLSLFFAFSSFVVRPKPVAPSVGSLVKIVSLTKNGYKITNDNRDGKNIRYATVDWTMTIKSVANINVDLREIIVLAGLCKFDGDDWQRSYLQANPNFSLNTYANRTILAPGATVTCTMRTSKMSPFPPLFDPRFLRVALVENQPLTLHSEKIIALH